MFIRKAAYVTTNVHLEGVVGIMCFAGYGLRAKAIMVP